MRQERVIRALQYSVFDFPREGLADMQIRAWFRSQVFLQSFFPAALGAGADCRISSS
jgi:hypothetical protein